MAAAATTTATIVAAQDRIKREREEEMTSRFEPRGVEFFASVSDFLCARA